MTSTERVFLMVIVLLALNGALSVFAILIYLDRIERKIKALQASGTNPEEADGVVAPGSDTAK